MRALLLCAFFSTAFSTAFADKCQLENLTDLEYTDIECQFYMGTTAYRNKVFSVAAAHWQYVINSPEKWEGEGEVKAMALSTLTFLKYNGLGVDEDKTQAVELWKSAVVKGEVEARKHLGYAFSDVTYSGVDLVKALGWYESVALLYPSTLAVDEITKEVVQEAELAADKLRSKMTNGQIKKAEAFAKTTL